MRERSKLIFGNRYMLEVCAEISKTPERTSLATLVGDSGLSPSLYAGPVHRLQSANLLVVEQRPGDGHRERWYRPVSATLWRAAYELGMQ